ncbi:MAG: hypothetical protein ABSG01_04020 [Anaerolineales bacterium]|jgi:predicted nucleotidyltransferase
MNTQFIIASSDPSQLEQATQVAKEFAQQYVGDEIVGIVFLGAIARGYFDHSADIDIAIFYKKTSTIPLESQFLKVQGFEIHIHLEKYDSGIQPIWDMAKRWTYSQCQIYYDPKGLISQLLQEMVPLKPEERKWLLMSGLALSDWYINSLAHLWVERGNMVSAHHMFDQGLNYFFDLLFAINNELVADMKWRYYCVEKLPRLPRNFHERIKDVMLLKEFSVEEIDRRQQAFMELWQQMVPLVEQEVKMPYAEIKNLV